MAVGGPEQRLPYARAHAPAGQVSPSSPGVEFNRLIMTAWRASGNNKGCKFAAESAPMVLLCLVTSRGVETPSLRHPVGTASDASLEHNALFG
ncbi:hypothetical protein OH77DRAFT_1525841 [Trametes cingulata]|nr:hypothetical protein OH77DRAFT_1525841 [Trametes cingulata]